LPNINTSNEIRQIRVDIGTPNFV